MFLDEVRLRSGVNEVITFFGQLVEHDIEEAVNFINDENLKFGTLFVLKNKIEELKFFQFLNLRSKIALRLTFEMLANESSPNIIEEPSVNYIESIRYTLLWMLKTGSADDGMDDEYDEVMDKTAILLTKVYKDRSAMSTIVDMIFERNRKGLLIHDLVWAFFEAKDPLNLIMIANRIFSGNSKDEKLACRLLSFIPGMKVENHIDKKKTYTIFMDWLEDNVLFLYYTGESFQQTCNPVYYKISEHAKYLCQCACIDTGNILKELTEEEHKLLEKFNKLDKETKELLSNFSSKMNYEDFELWKNWINQDISQQISMAIAGGRQ